eukprot:6093988-Pleurochrysis_carterae.AAC.1
MRSFDRPTLELQNAETKRVATSSDSKRLVLSTEGYQRQVMRGKQGPAQMLETKGHSNHTSPLHY